MSLSIDKLYINGYDITVSSDVFLRDFYFANFGFLNYKRVFEFANELYSL